jgi:hypothetical protein
MKPEEKLLNEVFDENNEFREATLRTGLQALRRQNRRRTLARGGAAALIAAMALLFFDKVWRNAPTQNVATKIPQPLATTTQHVIAGTDIKVISDDELLDLFPDRPVALVGKGESRRLILLDEANGTVLQ